MFNLPKMKLHEIRKFLQNLGCKIALTLLFTLFFLILVKLKEICKPLPMDHPRRYNKVTIVNDLFIQGHRWYLYEKYLAFYSQLLSAYVEGCLKHSFGFQSYRR